MTIFQFFLLFGIMIVLGTLTIVGWYIITRGEWETLPNGQKRARGKIFKWWFLILNKQVDKNKIFYEGIQFLALVNDILELEKYVEYKKHEKEEGETRKYLYCHTPIPELLIKKIYDNKDILFERQFANSAGQTGAAYRVSKLYPVYLFASWIRRPLATCATCFASVYGTIFYVIIIKLIPQNVFQWTNSQLFADWFFWIVYCFILAVTNTFIAEKYKF